jgi:precorrin-8X/cobalt-precorrin-8 methylmutase
VTGRVVSPIEMESYRILRATVDTSALPPFTRSVVERIVHTTADPAWLNDLVADEAALAGGAAALSASAPLVVDVAMVAAGVTGYRSICLLGAVTRTHGLWGAAAGIRAAAHRVPTGAVWAIGNAPTALAELLRLVRAGAVRPALVIGLPVGFVGAVEAKADLRATAVPQVSNRSARGGAAVAAAAVNALRYGDPLAVR